MDGFFDIILLSSYSTIYAATDGITLAHGVDFAGANFLAIDDSGLDRRFWDLNNFNRLAAG